MELVIVILIMALIAAVAIPRFSRGSSAAGGASLRATLRAMRNAIQLYAYEHEGQWPGSDGLSSTFWKQLTRKTDRLGNDGHTAGTHIYGPYVLDKVSVPVGPCRGAHVLLMTTNPSLSAAVNEAQTGKGWVYNYQTGEIIANTDDLDEGGMGYASY